MDISKINNVNGLQNIKKKPNAASGNFADFLSVEEEGQVKQSTPTNNLAALNFLNEVDEDEEKKRKKQQAVLHGEDILQELEKIHRSLLLGGLSLDDLRRILQKLNSHKQDFIDPKLDFIINEIEVRAAVELAKFGVF